MDDGQIAVQKLLCTKLTEIKSKNPSYSLRSFARKTGLSSGALSLILNGKRRVSLKIAERLTEALALDPQERSELLDYFPERNRRRTGSLDESRKYLQLSADHFKMLSEWQHFGILSLMNTRDFREEPSWMAHRLGLPVTTIKKSLERMLRAGLIEKNSTGQLKRAMEKFRGPDDIVNVSQRRGHAANLDLARTKLDQISLEKRDFTAVTMAIDPSKIPEAKERIRSFQDELSAFLESGTRSEVYKICMQLFPLTQIEGEK